MVAIDHVWTMQLFVLEAMIQLITHFPQMMPTDNAQNRQRADHPHVHQLGYLKNKRIGVAKFDTTREPNTTNPFINMSWVEAKWVRVISG